MNICLVSREYPPETGWGGIGTYTYYLSHGLAQRGHQVHVVAQALSAARTEQDGAVTVHRVLHRALFVPPTSLREWWLRTEYSYHVYRQLRRLMIQYRIDIVETPNCAGEGLVYSLRKRTPLVTRLHTHFSEVLQLTRHRRTWDGTLSCVIEDAAVLRSDLITCSTEAHAALLARELSVDPAHIARIPLGVPLPTLDAHDAHLALPHPAVLFVGRLERRKGVHVLFQAIPLVLREVPDAHFFLIGRDTFDDGQSIALEGSSRHSFKETLLRSFPEEYADRLHLIGYVTEDVLTQYYRACDLFVAPSLYESFGFIYIEAMSYGKPVIGCSVGGVPEVVEDGVTGLLVRPEDPVALADAITRLLQQPAVRRALGARARERVAERFTVEHLVTNTLSAYHTLL